MEIEIQSKNDNLLLGRTEVRFVVSHEGEGTPKRELIRTVLAEKLNAKKETIMVDFMKSSFGARRTVGYAKIYKSVEDAKAGEADPILKRNGLGTKKKPKKETKKEGEDGKKEAPKQKAPKAEPKEQPVEKPKEDKPAEKPKDHKPAEGKKE
jgi:small subunit ribosomal protein S24e